MVGLSLPHKFNIFNIDIHHFSGKEIIIDDSSKTMVSMRSNA